MSTLLGLFPAFHTFNAGGVQVSGELAWHALAERYGAQAWALQIDRSDSTPARDLSIIRTRRGALWRARAWKRRADIVLCWHADLLPITLIARARQRTALFMHGIEVWRRPSAVQRLALSSVDLILANSAHTLERAGAAGFMPRTARRLVVPLGLGVPGPDPVAPGAPPAALMIGRLDRRERYKGHDEVIRAWPGVQAGRPDAQLWIAGDGDLRAELQRLAHASGVGDSVIFYGRVSEQRKNSLLAAARCLLLPSRSEGFGLVYLEAMRAGRPCLVSTVDAGREVVRPPECGLAVEPGAEPALIESIIRLLDDGIEWENWSANARARFESEYTTRAFQERLLAALE